MKSQPQKPGTSVPKGDNNRPTRELFEHLVQKANRGDQDALTELRQTLDQNADIPFTIANLARHSEMSLIGLIAKKNLLLAECLRLKVRNLRQLVGVGCHVSRDDALIARCLAVTNCSAEG